MSRFSVFRGVTENGAEFSPHLPFCYYRKSFVPPILMAIRLLFQCAPKVPCSCKHQFGIMIIETAKGRDRGDKGGFANTEW